VRKKFRGKITQKVDGKGRVSIPAKFCRVLEACDPDWTEGLPATLYFVFGDPRRKFAEGYSAESMAAIEARIDALRPGTPRRLALEDVYYTNSEEVDVDATGRIVLPKAVRDKIGLTGDGEAVFRATGDRFQIWNVADCAETAKDPVADVMDMIGPDRDIAELLDGDWEGM
jgi:MraZ protein